MHAETKQRQKFKLNAFRPMLRSESSNVTIDPEFPDVFGGVIRNRPKMDIDVRISVSLMDCNYSMIVNELSLIQRVPRGT